MKRLGKKRPVVRIVIASFVAFIAAIATMTAVAQLRLRLRQTGTSVTFEHDGIDREYRIHVPASVVNKKKIPIVVCLHGGGGNSVTGSAMGLTEVADRHGFIAVYPNAINRHWNDGRDSPMFAEQDKTTDDVAFIKAIIDRVSSEHDIDSERVFATGLSNGGFMSQRLAVEASETFAAVGIVIASIGEPLSKRFDPKAPVSVLFMNGTEDKLAPYEGGPVGRSGASARVFSIRKGLLANSACSNLVAARSMLSRSSDDDVS